MPPAVVLHFFLFFCLFSLRILAHSHEEREGTMRAEVLASGRPVQSGSLELGEMPALAGSGLLRREAARFAGGGAAAGAHSGVGSLGLSASGVQLGSGSGSGSGTGTGTGDVMWQWQNRTGSRGGPVMQLEAAEGEGELPQLFNCSEGLARWEHGWSQAKKEWCCRHSGVGCPPKKEHESGEQEFTGQEMCEGHGFSEVACLSLGCCHFDSTTSLCYSAVAHHACTIPSEGPQPLAAEESRFPVAHAAPPIIVVPQLAPGAVPVPMPVPVPAPAPTLQTAAVTVPVSQQPHLQVVPQVVPAPVAPHSLPNTRAAAPATPHVQVVRGSVPGLGPSGQHSAVVHTIARPVGTAPTLPLQQPGLPGLASTRPPPPVLPPGTTEDDERVIEAASQAAVDEENRETLAASAGAADGNEESASSSSTTTTSAPTGENGKKGKTVALIVGLSLAGFLLLLLLLFVLRRASRPTDGEAALVGEDAPTAQAPEAAPAREDAPRGSRAGLQF